MGHLNSFHFVIVDSAPHRVRMPPHLTIRPDLFVEHDSARLACQAKPIFGARNGMFELRR